MKKSIVIIGAGIAGLSAGCYGQLAGYDTQIFELHSLPGGLCTSWSRQGYVFDGCIHWLVGSNKNSSMYKMWEDLGAVQAKQFVNHEEFTRVVGENGKTLVLYTNVDKLERHMKELAPGDVEVIEEWCGVIRELTGFDMPADLADYSFGEKIKFFLGMAPFVKNMYKYRKTTVTDFTAKFKDPFLRQALNQVIDLEGFPVLFFLATLAWMNAENAGYPLGGSLEFARGIERRYLELGGRIHYKTPVEKVLVRDNTAIGVRLADGKEVYADYVISAADGYKTIFGLLDGKYIDEKISGYYRDLPIFQPLVQVSLGVNRDLAGEPHSVQIPLAKPIRIANEEHHRMSVKHYGYDQTLAPTGKSPLVILFTTEYDYWAKLYEDPVGYRQEKERIANEVIDRLEELYPGVSSQVEVVDVATPVTYERYTGNWKGSMEGWLLTTKSFSLKMSKTLPGLKNFYMAGQWVEPGGGVPTAAISGRKAIKLISKQDKTRGRV